MPGISWPFILILRLRHYASYVVERAGHVAALLVEPPSLEFIFLSRHADALFFLSIDSLLNFDGSGDMLGIQ